MQQRDDSKMEQVEHLLPEEYSALYQIVLLESLQQQQRLCQYWPQSVVEQDLSIHHPLKYKAEAALPPSPLFGERAIPDTSGLPLDR